MYIFQLTCLHHSGIRGRFIYTNKYTNCMMRTLSSFFSCHFCPLTYISLYTLLAIYIWLICGPQETFMGANRDPNAE